MATILNPRDLCWAIWKNGFPIPREHGEGEQLVEVGGRKLRLDHLVLARSSTLLGDGESICHHLQQGSATLWPCGLDWTLHAWIGSHADSPRSHTSLLGSALSCVPDLACSTMACRACPLPVGVLGPDDLSPGAGSGPRVGG